MLQGHEGVLPALRPYNGCMQAYANSKNVKIVGDMPIYVGAQSADVWAHQELFELDDHGAAVNVAGVPPDAFSETGQLWGNPLYDWPVRLLPLFISPSWMSHRPALTCSARLLAV